MTLPSENRQAGAETEVTPEMVRFGLRELASCGLEDVGGPEDIALVERIFHGMLALAQGPSDPISG